MRSHWAALYRLETLLGPPPFILCNQPGKNPCLELDPRTWCLWEGQSLSRSRGGPFSVRHSGPQGADHSPLAICPCTRAISPFLQGVWESKALVGAGGIIWLLLAAVWWCWAAQNSRLPPPSLQHPGLVCPILSGDLAVASTLAPPGFHSPPI